MAITSLNLSLSNVCPAQCVFCPVERGKRDHTFMPPVLVWKIMTEVMASSFPWTVKTVQVGENGEALCNPRFLDILRAIRECLPSVRINLTTNMNNMTQPIAEAVLKKRLLDGLQLNIDGHNTETYEAQKGLSYEKVMRNFEMFMGVRRDLDPAFPVGVTVLTLTDYCEKVQGKFLHKPLQAPARIPPSSYEQVRASLVEKEWMTDDVYIRKSPVFFWAERGMEMDFPDLSRYQCPQLPRIENEAFISPSGYWYPCCLDSNQDQAFGNVQEKSLQDIHNSDVRRKFIWRLREKKFEEIGYPCNRVPFCRTVK